MLCTMQITMRISIFIITLIFCSSCSRDGRPFPTKMLVGINDSAIYHFDREGRTAGVEKEEYSIPGELVWLHRDTVELGKDFHALFGVYLDSFEIIVSEPSYLKLTREDYNRLPKDRGLSYSFKTEKKGTFNFKGEIRHDSIVRPFVWKFIVK